MRELLDRLLGHYRGHATIAVEIDPDRLRPSDTPDIRGDATRFRAATGWTPRIPIETTLGDLLDHERRRLAAGAGPEGDGRDGGDGAGRGSATAAPPTSSAARGDS